MNGFAFFCIRKPHDSRVVQKSSSKWNCKYHIVFAPKYRRKIFYNEKRADIREILKTLCTWKGVEIIEGEICPDYVHLLLSIPPKISVSGFMGYMKWKSV
jgi:putative transposase